MTAFLLDPNPDAIPTPCAYPGCDRAAHSRGLCGSHYARAHRGDPVASRFMTPSRRGHRKDGSPISHLVSLPTEPGRRELDVAADVVAQLFIAKVIPSTKDAMRAAALASDVPLTLLLRRIVDRQGKPYEKPRES